MEVLQERGDRGDETLSQTQRQREELLVHDDAMEEAARSSHEVVAFHAVPLEYHPTAVPSVVHRDAVFVISAHIQTHSATAAEEQKKLIVQTFPMPRDEHNQLHYQSDRLRVDVKPTLDFAE